MGRAWGSEAKEVQDTTICWQGTCNDHSVWDAKGVIMLDFFTHENYNNWSVLCKLARPAENRDP